MTKRKKSSVSSTFLFAVIIDKDVCVEKEKSEKDGEGQSEESKGPGSLKEP